MAPMPPRAKPASLDLLGALLGRPARPPLDPFDTAVTPVPGEPAVYVSKQASATLARLQRSENGMSLHVEAKQLVVTLSHLLHTTGGAKSGKAKKRSRKEIEREIFREKLDMLRDFLDGLSR